MPYLKEPCGWCEKTISKTEYDMAYAKNKSKSGKIFCGSECFGAYLSQHSEEKRKMGYVRRRGEMSSPVFEYQISMTKPGWMFWLAKAFGVKRAKNLYYWRGCYWVMR